MYRAVVVLALVGGCDYVLSINTVPAVEAPCGPYHTMTPVPISGVTAPTHFSVTPDASLAMVVGKDAIGVVRPILLAFDGTSWAPDPTRQTGLSDLVGAHIAPPEGQPDLTNGYTMQPVSPALIGWLAHPLQVVRYYYSTKNATWAADNAVGSYSDRDYDVMPGNVVITLNAGTDQPIRHVPVAQHEMTAANPDQILLTVNSLPDYDLVAIASRTQPLNMRMLQFDQAVITDDQQRLVYAARTDAGSFDIYASARESTFDAGGMIAGINTPDHDELEPWIDATCSKLYFRQVAVGQSGDPGTIFVAE